VAASWYGGGMATARALAQWATEVRERHGRLAVSLRRGLDLDSVIDFLRVKDLSNVTGLRIPGSVGLPGLRALVSSNVLPNLVSVSLQGFEDADDAVDVLFESPTVHRLRVLKVWAVSDAIQARLGRGKAKALRQLDIRNSPELTTLDRFFESPFAESLRFLSLERTGLSDATMFFHNPAVSGLQSLSLAACEFDSETIDHLAASPYMKGLRKLNLSHNPQDDVLASIYQLMRSGRLRSVEVLTLCGCEIAEIDWERVSFPSLRKLDLRDNPLGLDELLEILEAPGLPAIEKLIANTPEEFVPANVDSRLVLDDRKLPWA
jgi:Leucine-rich repeat (LRR) protein